MLGFSALSFSCPFCQVASLPPSISAAIVMMWDGSKSGIAILPLSDGFQRSDQRVISSFTRSGR